MTTLSDVIDRYNELKSQGSYTSQSAFASSMNANNAEDIMAYGLIAIAVNNSLGSTGVVNKEDAKTVSNAMRMKVLERLENSEAAASLLTYACEHISSTL